jgi:hypothetical protein
MVPAAPLLPTTDPVSAAVTHLAVPEVVDDELEEVDAVDEDALDEVEGGAVLVLDRPVVVVEDELEEHAARSVAPAASAASAARARPTGPAGP